MADARILEQPGMLTPLESEKTCPFCGGIKIGVFVEESSSYYECSDCGNGWFVAGEDV